MSVFENPRFGSIATALIATPLFGVALSLLIWPELPGVWFWSAAALMAAGIWLRVRERHEHEHTHEPLAHTRRHRHAH